MVSKQSQTIVVVKARDANPNILLLGLMMRDKDKHLAQLILNCKVPVAIAQSPRRGVKGYWIKSASHTDLELLAVTIGFSTPRYGVKHGLQGNYEYP